MKNSVFMTISKSKKSMAITLLSLILVLVSGYVVFRIAEWNKSQAAIVLSWAQERQAKNIWQRIAQRGPSPSLLIANEKYMASLTANIEDFIAIGIYGENSCQAIYTADDTDFKFNDIGDIENVKFPLILKSSSGNIAVVKLLVGNEFNRRWRGRRSKSKHRKTYKSFRTESPVNKHYALVVFEEGDTSFIQPFIHQMYLWPSVWLMGTLLWFSLLFYQIKLASIQDSRQQEAHLLATGRMSARLAHELKNPLGAIRGMSQQLQSEGISSETKQIMLVSIEKETNRLEDLTKNILGFSKPYQPKMIQANLVPLIRDMIAIFKISAPDAKIEERLPEDEIIINCDVDAIRQILLNLLKNSVDASDTPEIVVYLKEAKDQISLFVKDNGCGIPENIEDDIYAPFFSTKNNGYGLGLAISKKLAITNSGKLSIRNDENGGAIAELTLNKGREK